MHSVGALNPADLAELRPISRGLTPRIKSSQHSLSRSKTYKFGNLRSDSASSVQSLADENLTLADIERLFTQKVEDKKDDLRAAFQAFDLEGNTTITKVEFRRVIEHFLIPLTQSQFDMLLTKVPKRGNGSVAYMEFLRKYCTFSSDRQCSDSTRSIHEHQQNQTFWDLQCSLKDKIGSNLKNITRAFRLFDFNLDGQIQQHEFRRVLEAYCFPLSDHDFQRLWFHYSTCNTETVFYKDFLKRLGVDCENCHKKAPDCVKQALSWDMCNRMRKTNRRIKTAWGDADIKGDNFDELHTKFLRKMSMNYIPVQKSLHAFDSTGSGVISPEDLKFGFKTTEPILWKQFLDLFEDGEQPSSGRKSSAPATPGLSSVERILPKLQQHVQGVYTLLRQAFQIFDENKTELLPLTTLRRVLEGLTFPLTDEQFKSLVDLLDPECTGVMNYNQFIEFFRNRPKSGPMEKRRQRCYSAKSKTDQVKMSSVAVATWTMVETILKDRLSEQLDEVMDVLHQFDCTQNGTVSLADLKRVIHQYGLPVSDSHFEKLCTPFRDSDRVHYNQFLKGLGIQNISDEGSSTFDSLSLFQRSGSAFQAHLTTLKKEALQDVILKKLRDGLDSRGVSLHDCLRKSRGSPKGILTLADLTKILDDCMIVLDELQFHTLTQALGFHNGQISHFDFVSKFEKNTAKERNNEPEQIKESLKGMSTSLISAEEWLKHLKDRITEIHGDARTAFRLMDRNRDGVVNWRDFRRLFDSLQFAIKEKEYQRLLDFMGLQNDATLNYAEFLDLVHRSSQEEARTLSVKKSCQLLDQACEQIHDHLVADVRRRWSEISKDLCRFSEDGGTIIHKINLRQHLYKCALPITHKDFEKLWTRYDKEGKGFLTASELFKELNVIPEGQDPVSESPVTEGEPDTQLEQHVDRELSPPHCTSAVSQDLRSASQSPHSVEDLSPDRALQRMRAIVTVSSDTLQKAFSAFDKMGTGLMPLLEFRRVLDHFCLRLSDRQFNHLLKNLNNKQGENGMVNWKQFLETFNRKETAEEWLEKIEKVHFPSQACPLPVSEILGRIKDVVSTRFYVITKEMVALDYAQINVISKEHFRQICDRHFMRLTSDQFDNLWNILPVNAHGNLEFREFLKRFSGDGKEFDDHVVQDGQGPTSPPQLPSDSKARILKRPKTASCSIRTVKAVEAPEKTKRPYSAGAKTASSLNADTVNRRVRLLIHSCWKVILQRCRAMDPYRLGEIETGPFLGIMEDLHIQMSPLEFEQLMAKYDVKSNGRIRYSDFLRHFVLPHRPPVTSLVRRNILHLPKMPSSAEPLSSQCVEAMLRIHGPIQQFWRSMKQSFLSFDKGRSRKISVQDFRKVLRHYSIHLSEEEFFHITSFFDKDISGKISYNEFLSTFLG